MLGLQDCRVVITGGASNIGRGIVHGFARAGARIVLADVDAAQARQVCGEARELGAAAIELTVADLTLDGAAEQVVDTAVNAWGGVDALVNNVGWSVPGFIAQDRDRAKWQKTVEINLYTAIAATQAVLPPMREAGCGSIVFIASDAAFGQIRQGVYGATKAALIALARTTAREHGRHGVRSNVVCPGLVIPDSPEATGQHSLWAVGQDAVFNDNQIEYLRKDTPLRRLTNADDIANAVLWMSSETAARQVTGQVISVSGGYSMP